MRASLVTSAPQNRAVVRSLRGIFQRLLRIYFSEIEVAGEVPTNETARRLFAANHVNGLIDPLLVLTTTPCAISPLGKAPLFEIPVLGALLTAVDAVPVVRKRDDPNKAEGASRAMFEKVAAHFAKGGNVLIFPEGTSHNEPHLLPTRSGAAHMLALAHEQGTPGLTFQTVGLEFEGRDTFRSRALVIYGPVRDIDDFAKGPGPIAERIKKALEEDLRSLLFATAAWEDRYLIARVAELFANDEGDRTVTRFFEIARRAVVAKSAAEKKGLDVALVARATDYFRALDRARFSDEEVAGLPFARTAGGKERAVMLTLLLPFAVMGAVLFALPYHLPRWLTKEATRDVVSTYKLGIGLIAFPVWFFFVSLVLVTLFAQVLSLWASLIVAPALLFLTLYAAFVWLDRDERLLRRLRFFRTDAATRERLRSQRDALMRELRVVATDGTIAD